jgi:hypothetical protein
MNCTTSVCRCAHVSVYLGLSPTSGSEHPQVAELEDMGKDVVREGSRVLEGCNNLERAGNSLETGLARVVALGLHPFHHRCLDVYICLVCVNR